MGFVHLHCRSAYSLFEGTATPQVLVAQARKLGMSALAMTDRANLYGAIPFYRHALKAGIKPVIGMEVDLAGGSSLVLLARNLDGYRNLCHLASILRLNAHAEAFPPAGSENANDEDGEDGEGEDEAPPLPWDPGLWGVPTFGFTSQPARASRSASRSRTNIQPHVATAYSYVAHGLRLPGEMLLSGRHALGLVALSGGPRGLVNSLVKQGKSRQAARAAGMLLSAFGEGNFFIELTPQDQAYLQPLASLAAELNIPIMATNDVLYLKPEDKAVAEALARAKNCGMRNGGDEIATDDESPSIGNPHSAFRIPQSLRSAQEMADFFVEYPQAIANTGYIASRCELELPLHKPLFPSVDLRSGEDPYSRLWKLCFAGVTRHYRPLNDAVISRLKYELEIIEKLGFSPYFLIVHDIARFARRQGIPIMARGSAANSLAAYVLDITQVDPLANDLLFERFLNPSRAEFELPDIDLDLCWRRRDEVLHYVYRKYGADHVAIVGTHITFRRRSAWREMAKSLGVPLQRINKIASHLPHMVIEDPDDPDDPEGLMTDGRAFTKDVGSLIAHRRTNGRETEGPQSQQERKALEMAGAIEGLPRHAGMHCAGVVISPQSTPLADIVPLQRAARDPSLSITQYDKDAIEAMGLVKIDLLGSRALTTLVDALHTSGLVAERGSGSNGNGSGNGNGNGNLQKTFALIPFDDERIYNMMAQGETLGCFQLESPGTRGLLKWLRPRNLNDIAAAVSLFRPGPLEGGFLEIFMRRHLRQEPLRYEHSSMEPILRDTYGVILYQEQFLKLAHSLAGLSLGEAEKLRKEIARSHTPEQRARLGTNFVAGAIERGIDQLQAEEVWKVIAGYSGFGFCKAHACSYALTTYRSAYMKAHYPAHFLAAQLNNGGGYYGPSVYVEEARRLGIGLLTPHINESNSMCEVTTDSKASKGRAIRLGLQFVKGLSLNTILLILAQRRADGPFYSLQDLLLRVEMTPSEAASLVKVGACDLADYDDSDSDSDDDRQEAAGRSSTGDGRPPPLLYSAPHRTLNRRQMAYLLPSLITTRRPRVVRDGPQDPHSTGPLQIVLGDLLPGLMVSPNPRILGDLGFQQEAPYMEDYTPLEKLALERETLGFTLSRNPMEMHPGAIEEHGVVLCRDLAGHANKRVTVAGVAVAGRRHRTKAGEWMLFMSVQDTTGLIEIVLFPEAYKQHTAMLANNGVGPYFVTGQVQVSGRGRGIGVQPPEDLTPADVITLKMHPVVIAEKLSPMEEIETVEVVSG